MCERINGAPPSEIHHAAHSCGFGHLGCINPRHIRWATPQENSDDRDAHGRTCKGTRINTAKLTADKVLAIRLADGPQRMIAKMFGISQKTVWGIINKKTWRHI